MFIMKNALLILLFFIFTPLVSQESVKFIGDIVYDPFYDMEAELSDGTVIHLTGAAFHTMEDEIKYFFWVRRGTTSGIVTYPLELHRIKEIIFTDTYGDPENDYTPALIELTDGNKYDVFIDTLGYLGGFDQDFGSYGRLFMHYNLIEKITLFQDGSYLVCPHCGTVYYTEEEICPFDKTPLNPEEPSL